jgi:hypothetical protein
MNANDVARIVLETLTQHIPAEAAWVPLAALVGVTLVGLLMLTHGSRLAPFMSAVTFLAVGGIAGSFVSRWMATPVWPTIGAGCVVGLILGIAVFRVIQALLLASCFVLAGLAVYNVRVLAPHLMTYTSDGFDSVNQLVTLRDASGATEAAAPAAGIAAVGELGKLWQYLGQHVPNFENTFWALVVSTGLAGLALGLLLPWVSRAIWAATIGTALFLAGGAGLLQMFAPSVLASLQQLGQFGWLIVGAVWAASLLINLITGRRKRPAAAADAAAPQAAPAPA